VNRPHQSTDEVIILQTLRCIGHSGESRVADASGFEQEEVVDLLDRLRDRGLTSLDDGPFGGWSLTMSGRRRVESLVEEELAASGARADVLDAYRSFLPLNGPAMDVFHDWQMQILAGNRVLNDHTDAVYDDEVLARLSSIDESAQIVTTRLSTRLSRFSRYGPRLSSALGKARQGDISYVADDLESYHTVWFQLHEDLLVTCGISRDEERRGL